MARSKVVKILFLVVSILVYLSYGASHFAFLIFSLLTSYLACLAMKPNNKKILFTTTVTINALIFVFFKLGLENWSFFPWKENSIIAPLGISYYTLQVISYMADVYKGKYPKETNFLDYALYIFYFPCIFIGPIQRYDEFKKAFRERKTNGNRVLEGLLRILFGLFKKLVIAGRATILLTGLTSGFQNGAYALFAMLTYSILLYCDFSGGIDIVLGFSHMMGLTLQENFDRPYGRESIKEFWSSSWHISLSRWLKDYIYIPLGGNRVGKIRSKINVIITFLVSGFWHGANYLIWGLLNGIFVAFPRLLKTKSTFLNRVITFLVISLLWSFFIYPDTWMALEKIGSIFTTWNYGEFFANFWNFGLDLANYLILLFSCLFLFTYEKYQEKAISKIKKSSPEKKLIYLGTLGLIVLVLGIYGIGFHVEEFIYSKF